MKHLLQKPLPNIPPDIRTQLDCSNITLTPIEEKNVILSDCKLQKEVGYKQFSNGDWLVSMICPMPEITAEMIEWWFWWHCQDNLRYQVWYPGNHISIKPHKKDLNYFQHDTMPPFRPNTQCPVERIGNLKMPLQINFVTPKEFGFSEQIMKENEIALIECGHVSAFGGIIKHTEMAHIYKHTKNGLQLISRFWLGKTLKNPLFRKAILTENTARQMAEHCCIEYRNLVEILPDLYQKYHNRPI